MTIRSHVLTAVVLLAFGLDSGAWADEFGWVPAPILARLRVVHRDKPTQGPHLQGGSLEGTILRGRVTDRTAQYDGADVGPRAIVAKVVRTVDDPCRAGARLYELAINDRNPCQAQTIAAGPDASGLSECERRNFAVYAGKAVIVPGAWDGRAGFVAAGTNQPFFSFSCQSGVAAKCMRWGYRPDGTASQLELYQACMRAARADYCGVGRPMTCPDTIIEIADRSGISKRARDTAGEQLEADWTKDGAKCLHVPRLPGCNQARGIAKLKQEIERDCAAHGHPIVLDKCPTSCAPDAPTCGSLLRTWTVPGQDKGCAVTREWCPSES